MLVSRRPFSSALAAALVLACVVAAPALAAPITVKLRVEGSAKTLFEGPVSVEPILDPPGLSTPASEGAHPCDVKDNGANEGFGVAAATPTAALFDGATIAGLAFNASWSSKFNDFFVTQVGPDVEGGPPEFAAWGYAVNYTTAGVGGCQFQLAPGSEVLWGYNYFNLKHLLALSGPSSANAGSSFTLHVVDGQTGEPVSGTSIGELSEGVTTPLAGAVTDAAGNATVTLASAGSVTLKATGAESLRSNALGVCVHSGNDGTCGTSIGSSAPAVATPMPELAPANVAEVARIEGIRDGRTYRRHRGPRVLRGTVEVPANGSLRDVRISLERRYRGRCFKFNGSREKFERSRCGTPAFFSVGAFQSFSYLLPAPLAAGRYVFEIEAVDASGKLTKLVDGVSHVVFRVR